MPKWPAAVMASTATALAGSKMWRRPSVAVVAVVLLLSAYFAPMAEAMYWDRTFTVIVPQNKIDCYYLSGIKFRQDVQIDFQVSSSIDLLTS